MLKQGFLAALVFFMFSAAVMAGPNWLITPDEAARVRSPAGDYKELVAAVEGPGPQIIVMNPKALSRLVSPIDVFIAFKPGKSGQPPDT